MDTTVHRIEALARSAGLTSHRVETWDAPHSGQRMRTLTGRDAAGNGQVIQLDVPPHDEPCQPVTEPVSPPVRK